MQVIVLGSTAVIGLVYIIKSASTEICDRNGKLRHFDKFFQNCTLKETSNPKYIEKLLYFIHPEVYCRILIIPNGLRYLIPSGHITLMRLILNLCLSVSACSRLQWSQELLALLRVVSPKLQWFLGTHRGMGTKLQWFQGLQHFRFWQHF